MSIREILTTLDYGPAPEDASAVRGWLAARDGWGQFIDGAFTAHDPARAIAVENPATGEVIAAVTAADAAELDRAVAAATRALPGWQALGPTGRARFLYALARAVQKRERFLSVLETIDNGKPIRESRDIDIPLVARHFYHHAGWAAALPAMFPGMEPVGVCAQVIPWNFPLLMLAWKVAPALAAGNTVVLKPAEQTPLTALAFAEICAEIGLPAGVLNIVTGAGETGAALVSHPGIAKVAFTGSTEVGRAIRRATAGQGKSLTLELGGKSPFIVFASADLDAAVEGVVDGIWFNGGQVCCAGSRLLVQEPLAERFQARLAARLAGLRVGDPLDKSTDIGAIVSAEQLSRINGLLNIGRAEGAVIHQSGPVPEGGHFCAPGFVTGAATASTLQTVEIFGPIATLTTFRTPDEAVELANNTAYGLAASIWAQDIDTAMDAAAKVKAGVVWINGTNLFDAAAPFGGMRESGFGREGGAEGMLAYLRRPGADDVADDGAEAGPVDLSPAPAPASGMRGNDAPALDRTIKLFIGGRQVRADGGASYALRGPQGVFGAAALGGRKDIRNAVEAARKAAGWSSQAGHNRAQVLWFMAENMDQRRETLARALALTGTPDAEAEIAASIDRLGLIAGLADKLAGRVQSTRARHLTVSLAEPWGVMGLACPHRQPLLSMVTMIGAAIAMGNRVVCIPDPRQAWLAADLAQLCDSSDVPGGVVNLVTGDSAALAEVLALHDDVDALWHQGAPGLTARLEAAAAGNLKPVIRHAVADWAMDPAALLALIAAGQQVKTIWVPYGA
ncbi:aldehyde dehydrogenase family protein [Paracoccus contaminans]|uniref:Aldehyde dehydrogenase n=1 Tax=Paracoccus contaminans TaxID=1945662 RepID=A0A1W6D1L9_9RHOB|nr:aldehyde dehydrogenase family protein [Paracoccus contaminans]ARJ70995.1 aldehyde dehydrogenase [Paracoccus contaminans]